MPGPPGPATLGSLWSENSATGAGSIYGTQVFLAKKRPRSEWAEAVKSRPDCMPVGILRRRQSRTEVPKKKPHRLRRGNAWEQDPLQGSGDRLTIRLAPSCAFCPPARKSEAVASHQELDQAASPCSRLLVKPSWSTMEICGRSRSPCLTCPKPSAGL